METRASHVLIGSFAMAVIVLAAAFVLWLGKFALDREWDWYDIVFREPVTGLAIGSAVQYSGIQVGEVRRLSLAPDDPGQAIARVRLVAGTPIRTDTHARLTFTGVTGVAIIQLTGGTPGSPRLVAGADGTDAEVAVIVADVSALQTLLASGEGIVESANTLLVRLSMLLQDDNVAAVTATLANVRTLSDGLAARSEAIGAAIDDMAGSARALRTALERSEQVLARLDAAAQGAERTIDDDLPALVASARAALASLERASAGLEGTIADNRAALAHFTEDGLGQVPAAVGELRATVRPLRRLVERLERQPGALLEPSARPEEYPPP